MMELYKGQLSLDEVRHELSYKELLLLKQVRIERLEREREEIEKQRAAEAKEQSSQAARNKIILP